MSQADQLSRRVRQPILGFSRAAPTAAEAGT